VLPNLRKSVAGADDKTGERFDFAGRLSRSVFDEIGIPRDADVYLCGPSHFMSDMKETLAAFGVAPRQIHAEIFSGDNSKIPGGIRATHKAPHLSADDDKTGPLVSFARSGIRRTLERLKISKHFGVGRSVRRPRPLVLPYRGLSQL
jgi:ferredoxin-NADP reductase